MAILDDILGPLEPNLGAPPQPQAQASPGILDDLLGPSPAAQPGILDDVLGPKPVEMGWLPTIAAMGARTIFPIAGAAIGAPTGVGVIAGLAAGGAAGEIAAQAIERAAGGRPEGFDKSEIATEAALSAVAGPFSRIRKVAEAAPKVASLGRRLAPALTGGAEGAIFGGVSEQARSLVETGEFADAPTTLLGAGVGGAIGAGIGAAAAGRGKASPAPDRMTQPPRPTAEFLAGRPARPAEGFQHGQVDPDIGFGKAMVDPATGEAWIGAPGDDHADIIGRLGEAAKAGDPNAQAFQDRYLGARPAGGKPHPWHQFVDAEGKPSSQVPDPLAPKAAPDPYFQGQSSYTLAEALQVDEASREAIRRVVPEVNLISPQTMQDLFDELLKNPAATAMGLEQTGSGKALLRLNRQVAEALDGRLINAPQAEAILKATGQGYEGIRRTASAMGLGLNAFSRLRKSLDKALDGQGQLAKKYGLRNLQADIFRLRRSLLVTQLSTAVRNAISQTGRYGFEGIVQSLQGAMGDEQATATAKALGRNFLRGNRDVTKYMKTVDAAVPGTLAQLARSKEDYTGQGRRLFGLVDEDYVLNKANWMNFHLNQGIDDHIRAKSFASFFEPSLQAKGLDPKALLNDPKGFMGGLTPQQRLSVGEAIEEATLRAEEISFAEPAQNMVFKGLMDLVNRYPVFTLATPFPRFMNSSFNFITKHNPTGLLKAFNQDVAGDPKKLAEAYARATAGTSMLAAGFAAKELMGGDKGAEVKIPGTNQIVDLKSFYPLSFYVTLADMVEKMAGGKTVGQIPFEDIRESFFALGRFSDSVPNAVQLMIGQGDIEGFGKNVEAIAGDFLGGFAVGLRTPKDIVDGLRGIATGQNVARSVDKKTTSKGRLLGSLAESFPGMAELGDFPRVINPASGKDVADNTPVKFLGVTIPTSIFRQVSGLNVRDRLPIESYLKSLEMDPFKMVGGVSMDPRATLSGGEQAQTKERNLTRTLLGPLLAARLAPRIESLKGIPDKLVQRDVVRGIIDDAREDARKRATLLLRQQDPRSLLTLQGSRSDTGRKSRRERGRARRQLTTRFGVPNPDEDLGY